MKATFKRFSWRARRAFVTAQEEARLLKHKFVAPEHLFMSLAQSDTGSAARLLKDERIDLDEIRNGIEHPIADGSDPVSGALALNPRTKRVITVAIAEADRMKSRMIGTQHLLLGLLAEGEGLVFEILFRWGVTPDSVRAQTTPAKSDGPLLRETIMSTQSFTGLTNREKEVLIMRFGLMGGLSHTIEDVAQEFGVTPDQIRQIEAKALGLLTHNFQS